MLQRFIMFSMILFIIIGCGTTKDLLEYEGTVIFKDETSLILLREYIEIDQPMELEEALNKYTETDHVLEFSIEQTELDKIDIGDSVIVFSNGNFNDLQPPRGVAERVEVSKPF